jgi:two-component system, chemotaxis family, chemotaxis protein CheY
MRCLIVDDEMFCREFVATLLRTTADCDQAGTGTEALDKYKKALADDDPYDLIIMDIMMPGMSGQDAAKAVRQLEKTQNSARPVSIVMLTALNSANDAIDTFCTEQSATYLVKPVSKDGLFNVMSQLGILKR